MFLLPVSALAAARWAQGGLHDVDLIMEAPLVPEAVFLISMPDLKSYGQILRKCVEFQRKGAFFMIVRTGTPVAVRRLIRGGAIPTCHERDGRLRFFVPPEAFQKWLQS